MRRVLVVDDEPLIRKTISRLLSRHGYSVVVAADGNEALREANELPFDVALVDYEMPGRNGLKVLSELRERQPACIRVLMTGRRDFPLVVAAVNRGEIMRVVQKPFEPKNQTTRKPQTARVARAMTGPGKVAHSSSVVVAQVRLQASASRPRQRARAGSRKMSTAA